MKEGSIRMRTSKRSDFVSNLHERIFKKQFQGKDYFRLDEEACVKFGSVTDNAATVWLNAESGGVFSYPALGQNQGWNPPLGMIACPHCEGDRFEVRNGMTYCLQEGCGYRGRNFEYVWFTFLLEAIRNGELEEYR